MEPDILNPRLTVCLSVCLSGPVRTYDTSGRRTAPEAPRHRYLLQAAHRTTDYMYIDTGVENSSLSPSKKKEYCKSEANHLLWKGVWRETCLVCVICTGTIPVRSNTDYPSSSAAPDDDDA